MKESFKLNIDIIPHSRPTIGSEEAKAVSKVIESGYIAEVEMVNQFEDAGSTVIGFILACVAVYGDWAESNTVVALISPILIFWILIFDMVQITLDRIMTGKVLNFRQWIEYVGKDHLHHRLANVLGGNKKSVLLGDQTQNMVLASGDLIYVPRSGWGNINLVNKTPKSTLQSSGVSNPWLNPSIRREPTLSTFG
ncbi:MAG: hypothetical protein GY850_27085 [bacterium]|nr:hypothetical protein [bacterium]